MTRTTLSVALADDGATTRLGEDLAAAALPGDVLALQGDLGAGKTTLARGFVRAMADDPAIDVPSPTFTLVQTYGGRLPVRHFDLYRLQGAAELDELDFDDDTETSVTLVEWPERAGDRLPPHAIRVALGHENNGRRATITGEAAAMARIARSLDIRTLLEGAGLRDAQRRFLLGDASARAYETVRVGDGDPLILMNSPRRPDGPPVRDGKPYSAIAHLAETVVPFVAVAQALAERGYCAPKIHAQDLDGGLLLIEHLGDEGFLRDAMPVAERYVAAAELLADMHKRQWPLELEVEPGKSYSLPVYDRAALHIETELLTDWYMPRITGKPVPQAVQAEYAEAWAAVFDQLDGGETTLVMRDFHSPNIIWRDEKSGHDRLGIIDFQDAVRGPAAYDVASLGQDARVTIEPSLEQQVKDTYCAARMKGGGGFDRPSFERDYAIMAAQRNAKILGIFVRLDVRDGKPGYLKHLPRIRAYLARSLAHPALAPVAAFMERHGLTGAGP